MISFTAIADLANLHIQSGLLSHWCALIIISYFSPQNKYLFMMFRSVSLLQYCIENKPIQLAIWWRLVADTGSVWRVSNARSYTVHTYGKGAQC